MRANRQPDPPVTEQSEAAAPRIIHGSTEVGPQVLAPLPYEESALEPVISRATLALHHGKHHKGYVDRLNSLIGGSELADLPLEEIILSTAADPVKTKIFNNAAQAWNHDFFWRSLTPRGGGTPPAELCRRVEQSFGSFADMERRLGAEAIAEFGSGWAWLVESGEQLRVIATSNADNPLVLGMNALVAIDVWEHAYYLDYQNRREDYVHALLSQRINWEFAAENLGRGGA
jgi:Fe-Mn family superoxide dismutase